MFAKVLSATPRGVGALFVTVEVDRHRAQLPSLSLVGLPDPAVREAKERVLAALRRCGHRPEPANVVVNLAPADERKEGAILDLAIAAGLLASEGAVPAAALQGRLLLGELSLEGRVLPVRGILPVALAARDRQVSELVIPRDNAAEGAVVEGITVRTVTTLTELVGALRDGRELPRAEGAIEPQETAGVPDLAEVVDQHQARRALEVAAAGGHHLLFIGPPGAGKSMLARRLPGILPPLDRREALETTCVHSVSRRVPRPNGLLAARPFRSPHHTVSAAALIGGGSIPEPGEVSLAHNGVLFLDELTEFRRDVLEALRQPLEDRWVTVARARASLQFPARFQLVAAANPCPCGYLGSAHRECRCTPRQVQRYRSRLSGPLLDRIDLQVLVPEVRWRDLARPRRGESSKEVAARVLAARCIQRERFAGTPVRCNAEMGPRELAVWAVPDVDGRRLLERAAKTLALSARAFHRVLRVARTIADLEGSHGIAPHHLAEAIAYRALDRENAESTTAATAVE